MATTNFPTSLDTISSLPNPGSGDITTAPSHASQHDVENDAIRAIEAKIGVGASTPTANKVLRATGTGTTAYAQVGLTTDVTGTLPVANGGTGTTALGSGVATFLGTPSSANLASAVTDETGTGVLVFNSSPTIVTPTIASFTNAQHNHSNAAGGGQIGASGIVPGSLTNALLDTSAGGIGAALASWTPTWTNLVVSSSTVTAKFVEIGKLVFYHVTVVLAGGNAPTGPVSFTLPVTSITYQGTTTLPVIGDAKFFITFSYRGSVVWASTTTARFIVDNTASTYSMDANISATIPAAFTNGSELHAQGWFEAA